MNTNSPAALSNATIVNERPCHGAAIEDLLGAAFGPGRFAKTAYRLREGTVPFADLSFVAMLDQRLVGAVRLSPITIGGAPALFLGPLVVHPDFKNKGFGLTLLRHSLDAARVAGHSLIILVGDAPYYARAGFTPIPVGQVSLPGPVDPNRLLANELVAGALENMVGMARPAPDERTSMRPIPDSVQTASATLAIPGGGEGGEEEHEAEQAGE